MKAILVNRRLNLINFLRKSGYIVGTIEAQDDYDYSLAIVDNFKSLKEVNKDIPILFLGEKASKEEILKAYELGVYDYQLKSMDKDILIIKINLMAKYSPKEEVKRDKYYKFSIGNYKYNSKLRKLYYGEELLKVFTPQENKILKLLLKNRNKIVPYSAIMNTLWGDISAEYLKRLIVICCTLNASFKYDKKQVYLFNMNRTGYKLVIKN